jgi:predicted nucleotidyltransferase
MAVSINGILSKRAAVYHIATGSNERAKISTSVRAIKGRLDVYFGKRILRIEEFGSYKRDTILPRSYDAHSDVDLMVVFNTDVTEVNSDTYRKYLVDFAEKHYGTSEVYRTHPTVTLELAHIRYDLVPAKEEKNYWGTTSTLFIPKDDKYWVATAPQRFNTQLMLKNVFAGWTIKPVIRLMKAWNAMVGFPIPSFELEQEIVNMSFGTCISLEDYFFRAISQLSTFGKTKTASDLILQLKENARRVSTYLSEYNVKQALVWLDHILPPEPRFY